MNWLQYSGKRVIVSGCYSGIGHAAARQLLKAGAKVYGLDWKPCDLGLTSFVQVDLRDPGGITAAAATLEGKFDALFNCAGIPPGAPPLDVMAVNFLGAKLLTDTVAAQLAEGSAIVNLASTGGMRWAQHKAELRTLTGAAGFAEGVQWCQANAGMVAEGYSFSKEALIYWTLDSAASLIGRGIRVNCTLPGAVQTPMLVEIEKTTATAVIDMVAQPIGRRSSADEQAAVLLFLGSPAAGYINGAALPVDGGFMAGLALR